MEHAPNQNDRLERAQEELSKIERVIKEKQSEIDYLASDEVKDAIAVLPEDARQSTLEGVDELIQRRQFEVGELTHEMMHLRHVLGLNDMILDAAEEQQQLPF